MKQRWQNILIGSALLLILPLTGIFAKEIQKESNGGCLTKSLFQVDCPFCGMTRAFSFAAHGNFEKANYLNQGWSIMLFIIVTIGIFYLLAGITGKFKTEGFWAKLTTYFEILFFCGVLVTLVKSFSIALSN